MCLPAAVFFLASVPLEAGVQVAPAEGWNNIFAGGEQTFRYNITSARPLDGRLVWVMGRDARAIARGDVEVRAAAGETVTVGVRVEVPPIKEGVVFSCELTASYVPGDAGLEGASHKRMLWLFPGDPFADRHLWLTNLNIRLFDPERKTAERFAKAGIPFRDVRTTDALAAIRDGLVIVGEGASFVENRGLGSAMEQAAAGGVTVLCLAPRGGDITLPAGESGDKGGSVSRMVFRRADLISELDKRLDSRTWAPGKSSIVSSLVLTADRRVVAAEAVKGERGWPWLDLHFGSGGRLVFCGFGVIAGWDESPTPRFLLLRLLEEAARKTRSEPLHGE